VPRRPLPALVPRHAVRRHRALLSFVAAPLALVSTFGCTDDGTTDPLPGTGGTMSSAGTMNVAGTSAGATGGTGNAGGSAGASAGKGGAGGSSGASAGSGGGSGAGATSGEGGGGGASGASAGQGGMSSGGAAGVAGTAGLGGAGGNAAGASGASGSGGSAGGSGMSKSKGCGNPRTIQDGNRSVQSGGMQRTYVLRSPANYDNAHPYRLMLGFHGANGNGAQVAPSFFGIWELSEGSTIFVAPDAVSGLWNATRDTTLVTDLIQQLSDDLCIDTSRIGIEGFSQGAAMVWTLACGLPGKFRFAVVHSGGGLPMPQSCEPIPFWSALGTDGSGQDMSSDFFARTNGCTVAALPTAPTGGHACNNYEGCDPGFPTRWCDYDAGHTPSAVDAGQQRSWVPQEVWNFIKDY
jgi:dienelactone hydrolase